MVIKSFNQDFSVCKLKDLNGVDLHNNFTFISITDEEISLVCETSKIPSNADIVDNNWKMFRIEGILDFSLIGILAKIADLLANNNISIYVQSTFNTDYILVKSENYEKSINILSSNGYSII